MKRRRYSAQRRPLYSTYFTTTRRNDMSCKNMNSDFTLFIHSCVFPRAARNKKAIVSNTKILPEQFVETLLDPSKSWRDTEVFIYIYIWLHIYMSNVYILYIHICITIHATYITNYSSSFPFMGFWCPNKK